MGGKKEHEHVQVKKHIPKRIAGSRVSGREGARSTARFRGKVQKRKDAPLTRGGRGGEPG